MKKAPMWQYHREHAPEGKIFHAQADLDALDEAWKDSPAHFDAVTIPSANEQLIEAVKADALTEEIMKIQPKAPPKKKGKR